MSRGCGTAASCGVLGHRDSETVKAGPSSGAYVRIAFVFTAATSSTSWFDSSKTYQTASGKNCHVEILKEKQCNIESFICLNYIRLFKKIIARKEMLHLTIQEGNFQ